MLNTNWAKYPNRFQNLMRAISESMIKYSLRAIFIVKCGISKEDCSSTLKSVGLEDIKAKTN